MHSSEPGWYPDPTGRHELRWHGGVSWTHTVRDGELQAEDPIEPAANGGQAAHTALAPIDVGSHPVPAGYGGDPGSDPNVLWEGRGNHPTRKGTYRVTRSGLFWGVGLLSSRSEQTHVSNVRDVDVVASMTQKARGVASVRIHLNDGGLVTFSDLPDARDARDAINDALTAYRQGYLQTTFEREHSLATAWSSSTSITVGAGVVSPQPMPPEPAGPTADLVQQLKGLAELRDAGVLSDSEFEAQKAKLLG